MKNFLSAISKVGKQLVEGVTGEVNKQQSERKAKKNKILDLFLSDIEKALERLEKRGASSGLKEFLVYHHKAISELKKNDNSNRLDTLSIAYTSLIDAAIFGYLYDSEYLKPLLLKREQLVYIDEYGDVQNDRFIREVRRFTESHLYDMEHYVRRRIDKEVLRSMDPFPNQPNINKHFADDYFDIYIPRIIEELIEDHHTEANNKDSDTKDLDLVTDPYEYERTIAEVINSYSAKARVTKGSGDQGADVIATHNGEDYIIQCKLYSKPVGNKAVQEVSAAQHFYSGNHALVVTNSSFTKSARQLADKLGVLLLHHSQLADVFGEGDSNFTNTSSEESYSYEVMMEALNSYDTERLKEHASEFLDIFEPAISENMFVFDVGDCSAFVACFASDDEDVFRTYIDYLFKLTDGLSYDEKILFTFSDVEEDTLKFADDLDIRLFTDEKILDYLQGLIDIHIDEE